MNPPLKASAVVRVTFLFSLAILTAFSINRTVSAEAGQETGERLLEYELPKHLPVKVKIKKEKEQAFKNLNNEKWLRDFELEITNTGDKPIYFLSLALTLPEIVAPDGNTIGFAIHYGRSQLGDIKTIAGAEDVPIKPGETYVFSFPDSKRIDWERFRRRENKHDPKRLVLKFQILSFGDGTGFWRNDGIPGPRVMIVSNPVRTA